MYDIIIVGGGPAGLTAALYAARANKKILVIEAKNYGGRIIDASVVSNYPGVETMSGYEFATKLYEQVEKLNVDFKIETVLSIDKDKNVYTNKNKYSAKAIILSTGTQNKKLKIENEENLIGKGISYCATCDGNFYKNKVVAVIGSGNTALEDTLYLSNLASKVYLVHWKDTFTGEAKMVDEIKEKDNIEIIDNSSITKINGIDKLESIVLNDDKEIDVDGLFIAIGQEPNNIIFKNVIDIDSKGYIKTDDGVHTNVKGIYVAGDAREKLLRQLTTAVSDGSIAATVAIKEMEN